MAAACTTVLLLTASVIIEADASRICAPRAVKPDVLDDAVAGAEENRAAVATERVVPFGLGGCSFHSAPVAWSDGMVEQQLLVEFIQFPHMPSHSLLKALMTGKPSRLAKSISSNDCKER